VSSRSAATRQVARPDRAHPRSRGAGPARAGGPRLPRVPNASPSAEGPVAEVTAQPPSRRARADAGLRDRDMTPLGIIRRLRHPRDGACRHCAAAVTARDTMMSHYFCRDLPLLFPALTLAITALSRRVSPRATAAPLVTGRCPAQLLPAVHVLAAPQAVRLPPVARATDSDGAPTASAVKLPIGTLHPRPPSALDSAGGGRHKGPAAKPPQAHRNAGGPGLTGIEPGPSLYLPIIIAIPSAQQADGQQHPSGKSIRRCHYTRRQRGRRMRPSTAGAAGPLAGCSGSDRSRLRSCASVPQR
jgi:hypothetical protein